jgi:diadenosine tetraphosphate (Ap4A) HIT family hydrolase
MNATLEKFGYPESLIRDYRHWSVLLRPAQVTLGALVLGARSDERAFSRLPAAAFAELAAVVSNLEHGLKSFRPYQRINYLMLMMIDPHVHFHVLPRYEAIEEWDGFNFADSGWPGPPDLKSATEIPDAARIRLRDALRAVWAGESK